MRTVAADQACEYALKIMGLNPSQHEYLSVEAIATMLRRIAGADCPCSAQALAGRVCRLLSGMFGELGDDYRDMIRETVDDLVAIGDLIELPEEYEGEKGGRQGLLFAAPPRFVRRKNRRIFVIGIVADHPSALPDELQERVVYRRCLRYLAALPDEDLPGVLTGCGLPELSGKIWLASPADLDQVSVLEKYGGLLDGEPEVIGELEGLTILQPEKPISFYRGRWAKPPADATGRFVARRPRAYGADLWCYVELRDGLATRLLDFPTRGFKYRACDEAWHLQAAIDSQRGSPQLYRKRPDGKNHIMDVFSPLPLWVIRRWESIGEAAKRQGCLLSYVFEGNDIDDECAFLERALWMKEMTN